MGKKYTCIYLVIVRIKCHGNSIRTWPIFRAKFTDIDDIIPMLANHAYKYLVSIAADNSTPRLCGRGKVLT